MFLTYRYRVKDATTRKHLDRHAIAVNQVWNYCCEVQRKAETLWKAGLTTRWPSGFDLINLTAGTCAELGLQASTINEVCRRFAKSRDQHSRCPRFRSSYGSGRSLGWLPMRAEDCRLIGNSVRYRRRVYRLWLSRPLAEKPRYASFSQDARGRWYFNALVAMQEGVATVSDEIGIDLGLKTLGVCSNGEEIPNLRYYRQHETALGKAQRAGNKARVKAIHAKITNCRRHQHHEITTRLARANRRIVVGNVSASKLAKTPMAKSVLDAGWSSFRFMLAYKAIRHGHEFIETSEAFTTQVCSECGSISGPKGIAHLGIRHWTCSDCGYDHDRDLNSAKNILRVGLERQAPVEEIRAIAA